MFHSQIERGNAVPFPEFTAERIYMEPFCERRHARWTDTVAAMLGNDTPTGPIYLMVDQSHVQAHQPQRRPGIHIDGYWVPTLGHQGHRIGMHEPRWGHATFDQREDIILASDVTASRALVGAFDGPIGEGGDCSHLNLAHLDELILEAGYAYRGNVTCLHESLPVPTATNRTLVRLNVPYIAHRN